VFLGFHNKGGDCLCGIDDEERVTPSWLVGTDVSVAHFVSNGGNARDDAGQAAKHLS
jgi:hypothetical protein